MRFDAHDELARQARLADPGVPDDHEPARDVAPGGTLEERLEARQLLAAADERRVEAARDRVGRRVEAQDTEAAALVRHDVDGRRSEPQRRRTEEDVACRGRGEQVGRQVRLGPALDRRAHLCPGRRRGADVVRRAQRTQRVVVVRDRCAEDGDGLVESRLEHGALVALDRERHLGEETGDVIDGRRLQREQDARSAAPARCARAPHLPRAAAAPGHAR